MLDHLSYSSIACYQACPRSWKWRYIDKPITPTSANLVFGSAFHKAVETMLQKWAHDSIAFPEPIWESCWEQQLADNVSINWNSDDERALRQAGLQMLNDPETTRVLYDLKPMIEDGNPVIERKLTLNVPGVPVPVIGYMDLLTADGIPSDFKTAGRAWTEDKAQEEDQASYYLAALNQAGAHPSQMLFRHVVWVKPKPGKPVQVQQFVTQRTFSDLLHLFLDIQDVWKAIEAQVFPNATGTWKCSAAWCEFWPMCEGKR